MSTLEKIKTIGTTIAWLRFRQMFSLVLFCAVTVGLAVFFYDDPLGQYSFMFLALYEGETRGIAEALKDASPIIAILVAIYLAETQHLEAKISNALRVSKLTAAAKYALRAELEVTLRRLLPLLEAIKDEPQKVAARTLVTRCDFPRPYSTSIAAQYPDLPQELVTTCATREAEFSSVVAQLTIFVDAAAPRNVKGIEREVRKLIKTVCRYLKAVAPDPYGPMNFQEIAAAMDDPNLRPKMAK